MTPEELEQIVKRHRNCPAHVKARQTWKDMQVLLDEIERLRAWMPKVTQIGNTITVDTPIQVKLPRVGE